MDLILKKLFSQNKHLLQNLVGNLLPIVIGIGAIPLLHGQLGDAKFGVIVLIWITSNMVSLLDFGTVRVVTQTLAKFKFNEIPEDVKELCQSMASFLFVLSLLLFVFGYCFRSYILNVDYKVIAFHEVTYAYYITISAIPFILLTSLFKGILESQMMFDITNIIRVPMMSFFYVVPCLIVYLFGTNLVNIAIALAVGRLFFLLIHVYFVRRELPVLFAHWRISTDKIIFCIQRVKWFGVVATLSPLIGFMDRYFINILISTTMVGFYATPYEIVSRMSLISASISSILIPILMKSYLSSEREAIQAVNSYINKLFYILLPPCLILMLFSKEILKIWMGQKFSDNSFLLLKIFSVGMLLNSICSVPNSFMLIKNEEKKVGIFYIIQMLFYPLALYFGIKESGMIGGAIVWLIRILFDLFFFIYNVEHGYLKNLIKGANMVKIGLLAMLLAGGMVLELNVNIKILIAIPVIIFSLHSLWKIEGLSKSLD